MKLNLDCMRSILLFVEECPCNSSVSFKQITFALSSEYAPEDIYYSIMKLCEASFIKATIVESDDFTIIRTIDDITYEGHQFLADIRTDKVWRKTKSILENVGSTSVSAIVQVASGVVQSIVTDALNH